MLKFVRRIIFVFFSLFLVAVIFSIGFLVGQNSVSPEIVFGVKNPELGQSSEVDFSLFWSALATLEGKFVNKEKIDFQKIVYGAISGMVKSLGDPYTVFFPPEEAKRFNEDVKGSFEGVGMEIDVKKGQLIIVAPLEGTPAQKAGLKAGDKILAINSTSTADLTLEEAVKLIRGPRGTAVTLTVQRESWEKNQDIKIIRETIQVPSLKLELKKTKKGDTAYLKIYQFSERTSFEFQKTALDILNGQVQGIILDLRNNPGGYLEVAQDVAGWFLERGQTVVVEDFGFGKDQNVYKAEGPALLSAYPLVILINQGSASASEILAGALRDNRGISLVGEKSFGKGSVQELENLTGGSSLKITVAKWLTPKGKLIADVGLEPDFKIEVTEKDFEAEKDPQLEKALEIIEEIE